jgi:hypothetical protein
MVMVMLPAPSRDTAAEEYVEKATAAPEGLYEGAAQDVAENTQFGAAHEVQLEPPNEFATAPSADQMAI